MGIMVFTKTHCIIFYVLTVYLEGMAAVKFGESGWMKILVKSLANEKIDQKVINCNY